MKKINWGRQTLGMVTAGALLLVGVMLPLNNTASADPGASERALEDLTAQDWKDVADCELHFHGAAGDWFDPLVCGKPVMDPSADDDGDGLTNAQELKVKVVDGQRQLVYLSHPKLNDTDGDGYFDNKDDHKLRWDISSRDTVFFMELAYRNPEYVKNLLAYPGDPNFKVATDDAGKPRWEQKLIRAEMAPYWAVTYESTTDESGFDAYIFQFSNKTLPILDDKSATIVAFRGTGGDDPKDGDAGADAKLGTGLWPAQAQKAKELAQMVNDEHYRHVVFTGHSLGGFLAQIAYIWSRGGYYYATDTGPGLWHNPNVEGLYTYNAPIIRTGADRRMQAYSAIAKDIFEKGGTSVRLYATSNDSLTYLIPHAEPATIVGSSDGGHSSLSFFEDKFADYFSVPPRRVNMQHANLADVVVPGLNNLDPEAQLWAYDIVEKGADNTETVLASDRKFEPADKLPKTTDTELVAAFNPNYQCTNCTNAPLTPGKVTKLIVTPAPREVVYTFIDEAHPEGEPVATVVVNTVYKGTYEAPALPANSKELYICETANGEPVPVIPGDQLTDPTTTVKVIIKEVPPVVTTVVFHDKDADTNVGDPVEIKRAANDTTPVTVADAPLPEGYVLVGSATEELTPGKSNVVEVEPRRQEVTYRFMFNGAEVGSSAVATKYGQAAPLPEPPYGYEIIESEKAKAVTRATSNETVDIEVRKQTFDITFSFEADGTVVGTSVVHADYLDAADVPTPPAGYMLADGEAQAKRVASVTKAETVKVAVVAAPLNVTYQFVYDGKDLGKAIEVGTTYGGTAAIPAPPTGYELKAGEEAKEVKDARGNEGVIRIEVVKREYEITYIFTFEGKDLGEGTVVKAKYEEAAPIPAAPEGYELKSGEEAKAITSATENTIVRLAVEKKTEPVTPTPGPVEPTPSPVTPTPTPIEPTPGPVEPTPGPVTPTPSPVEPTPAPVTPTTPVTPEPVKPAPVTPAPAPLPATGAQTGLTLLLAMVLTGAGAALLIARRYRMN